MAVDINADFQLHIDHSGHHSLDEFDNNEACSCEFGTETKERENLVNAEHPEDFGPRFRPGKFHPRSLDFSGGTAHTARNAKTSPLFPAGHAGHPV